MTYTLQHETPVGPVTITATGEAVTQIRFGTAQVVPGRLRCRPRNRRHTPAAEGGGAAPGVFRRHAPRLLAAARTRRNALPAIRLAGVANHPLRRNPHLRTYRHADRAPCGTTNRSAPSAWPTTATPSSSSFPATASWATTASSRATPGAIRHQERLLALEKRR